MAMSEGARVAIAGLAIMAAGEVPNHLAGLLPSLLTIRRFGAEDIDRQALRTGEVIGASMALAIGVGASMLSGSPIPFLATVVVLVVYLLAYEHSIRNPSPNAKPINDPANVGP